MEFSTFFTKTPQTVTDLVREKRDLIINILDMKGNKYSIEALSHLGVRELNSIFNRLIIEESNQLSRKNINLL